MKPIPGTAAAYTLLTGIGLVLASLLAGGVFSLLTFGAEHLPGWR
ncbi:MAG: hypothetical protein JWO72_2332 [Caulobacteraceae bacterium]|jgi:hypothetical protein|nr:hypothetical protein [Caulobacteraceae bacterium]